MPGITIIFTIIFTIISAFISAFISTIIPTIISGILGRVRGFGEFRLLFAAQPAFHSCDILPRQIPGGGDGAEYGGDQKTGGAGVNISVRNGRDESNSGGNRTRPGRAPM